MPEPQERRRWCDLVAPPRRLIAFVFALAGNAALVPVFATTGMRFSSSRGVVLAALGIATIVAYLCNGVVTRHPDRRLGVRRVRLDGTGGVALCALAFAGPLPAFGFLAVTEVLDRVSGRMSRWSVGGPANIASFGWGLLAADGALRVLHHAPGGPETAAAAAALLPAGVAYYVVNYAITTGLVGVLALGRSVLGSVRQEFVPSIPAVSAIVLLAAATVPLTEAVGAFGLLPLIGVVAAPQALLALLSRMARPSHSLPLATLREHYARALADQLGATRRQRRLLAALAECDLDVLSDQTRDSVTSVTSPPIPRPPSASIGLRTSDWACFLPVLLSLRECWDGSGWPGAAARNRLPLEVRIVHVAHAWAQLTCADGPRRSHAGALQHLCADAGYGLDPTVVSAVEDLLASEPFPTHGLAIPVLHRLPRPAPISRATVAQAVALLT